MNKKIKLFEAFAGIGSQHRALENIGLDVEVVGLSEWYIDAIIAYGVEYLKLLPQKIERTKVISFLEQYSLSKDSKRPIKNWGRCSDETLSILEQVIKQFGELDIRHINGDSLLGKNIDLFTYSFPCQDISQQGSREGFSKGNNSRSGLLWEIERILTETHSLDPNSLPKYLIMENVKAILHKRYSSDLKVWMKKLKKLGYTNSVPFIVNASDIGSPQKRERVFIMSSREQEKCSTPPFATTARKKKASALQASSLGDIIEKDSLKESLSHTEYSGYEELQRRPSTKMRKAVLHGYTSFSSENYVYFQDSLVPTITATGSHSRIKYFGDDGKIYFLTALEHCLLQGFDTDFYSKLKELGYHESKIKFLVGNSIHVKVLEKIFEFYLK